MQQGTQHLQGAQQGPGRCQRAKGLGPFGGLPFRSGRGNDGAEQHHGPNQIHPDQEDRQGGQRAIDTFEGPGIGEVKPEQGFQQLKHHRSHPGPQQRIANPHTPVWQGQVKDREPTGGKQERQQAQTELPNDAQIDPDRLEIIHGKKRCTERQPCAHEQGPQGQGCPVSKQPHPERAGFFHPPDRVERAFDGREQHDGGHRQPDHPKRCQLAGIRDKGVDIVFQLTTDMGRGIGQHDPEQLLGQTVEDGKCHHHRKRDGEKWHDGQQRGVAERGRGHEDPVPGEAANDGSRKGKLVTQLVESVIAHICPACHTLSL